MNNFRIKTKRDWCIAAVLTTLIIYAISLRYSVTFQAFLLKYGNPMMTKMNQPLNYGNLMFTIVVVMILVEIVLIRHKKSKKLIGILAVGTIIGVFGIYQLYLCHVNQIISIIEEEDGRYTSIGYWGEDDWNVDESTIKEIISLCEELEPVSKKEQVKLKEELMKNEDYILDTLLIWAHYPEKWGESFDLMINVYEDKIFIDKGQDHNQQAIIIFFEDNGLLELVNEVKEKQ